MSALTNSPTAGVVGIVGQGIAVSLRPIPGQPNHVDLHITRAGKIEHSFTLTELQSVLSTIQSLLPHAHGAKPVPAAPPQGKV